MRKKKYATPKALESAIEKYIKSISRIKVATEMVPTGEKDEYGHAVMRSVPILNDDGEEIRYREFAVPPRMTALQRHLRITAQTWSRYASGESAKDEAEAERWREVCSYAKAVCEDYLKGELLTRHKGVTGIMFELKANYGYSDRQEIEIKHSQEKPMTMDEREAILRGLGMPLGSTNEAD